MRQLFMLQEPKSNLIVHDLRSHTDVIKFWSFFQEGLLVLNRLLDATVSNETLFRVVNDIVVAPPEAGKVLVITDKAGTPVFYIVVFDNTSRYHKRQSALIYAAYSNNKVGGVTRYGLSIIEQWAKDNGYNELHAFSPRITGSGFRLFEGTFKFRRRSVLFYKPV